MKRRRKTVWHEKEDKGENIKIRNANKKKNKEAEIRNRKTEGENKH